LLSVVFTILPITPVLGSTGHPTLGVTNTDTTQPTTYTPSTSYVDVVAGSDTAVTDGPVTGYFAIDFGTYGGAQVVTFSGSQFFLYLSKDGLSQISASDIEYTGPTLFSVSDLTTNGGWHKYTETNGTFYVGQTTSGQEVITGPVPIKISNSFKYIKIYDGSTTSVAVSAQFMNIIPGPSTTTTATTTIIQTNTQTKTTTQPTTIIQSTTIAQPTTQTETTTQPTTTTVTTTTASISTSTASTFTYATLGATAIVILTVAALAAWVLRGRRP